MKKLSFLIVLLSFFNSYSLNNIKLSDKAEISLITCGPGEELYTAFGHSAFRIKDQMHGIDKIYNYGTFDFNKPNFYTNFAEGYLYYYLSTSDTGRFLRIYNYENRWVKEQVLNFTPAQNQKVFNFLETNTLIDNREYTYNYFFNNCSTKLYDVVNEVLGTQIYADTEIFTNNNFTHRDLIKHYLKDNAWGEFGINLCLGSVIDRPLTEKEYLFLPDYVYTYFNHLKIKNPNGNYSPLIKENKQLIYNTNKKRNTTYFNTPVSLFTALGLIVILITYLDIKRKKRAIVLDFSLLFITGLIGTLLFLIWIATNHISAHNNFNVLWAFPPNLIVSFYFLKRKLPLWTKKYLQLQIILIGMVLIFWITQFQVFSIGIIPLLGTLVIRYLYLLKEKY